jgi:hypothetical protein
MTEQQISQSNNPIGVPLILIRQVRAFVQDYAQVNELFDGQESTDELIGRCLVDTIDDWNYTPPLIGVNYSLAQLIELPALGAIRKNVVDMAAARLLRILVIKHARQDIPYTAGNVNIQPHSIWRNLEGIIAQMEAKYENFKLRYKSAQNVTGGYRATMTELYDGYDYGYDGTVEEY